ncbi:MAG: YqgE/AlgH family protein, partial [Taibaiella sp.]|nr:YqgE/AlgH family protein [Taibaiella sp.]
DIRLFVGYAGWSPGQLENEIKDGSWLIADVTQQVVFDTAPENVWKAAVLSLGNEYRHLVNMPLNPGLN